MDTTEPNKGIKFLTYLFGKYGTETTFVILIYLFLKMYIAEIQAEALDIMGPYPWLSDYVFFAILGIMTTVYTNLSKMNQVELKNQLDQSYDFIYLIRTTWANAYNAAVDILKNTPKTTITKWALNEVKPAPTPNIPTPKPTPQPAIPPVNPTIPVPPK